ncbi:MAG: hypothetical protein M0Z41_13815 [Peptococcaceae bacterium]|jgi:hypothetical protein|nr:hypothetical protein [Peptococcaceae bacterium]
MPPFIQQIMTLFSNAGGWITGLAGVAGGAMTGYHAIMRNLNDDPQMVSHHTGSIKKVLTGTAIAVSASGLATWLASQFH